MVDENQNYPAIAYNPDKDEHLVVWSEQDAAYGQIFTAKGVPEGGSFFICTQANSLSAIPAVVYNTEENQYLVVCDSTDGLYGQLVDAGGALLNGGVPFVIDTWSGYTHYHPSVAYNDDLNQYLVVYHGGGQLVDANGDLLKGGFGILDGEVFSVAYNAAADEYLVVSSDGGDIWGQRVDAEGNLLDNLGTPEDESDPRFGFAISTTQGDHTEPAVAYNTAADEYLVVWGEYRCMIYGQRVDADGALLPSGSSGPAVNFTIFAGKVALGWSSVAYSADHDQYLVVWRGVQDPSAGTGCIYGRRVGSDGTLTEQEYFAISHTAVDQAYPAVSYSSASGQYMVVWEDRRNGGRGFMGNTHIYGQRVWWPGLPVGREFAVSSQGTRQDPAVAYDTYNYRYLAVWADDTSGDFDIYGQLYDHDGYPIDSNFPITDLEGDQTNPDVVYNRDERQYLVIFEEPGGIGGQVVTTQGSLHSSPFFLYEGSGAHNPAVAYAYNTTMTDEYYRHYLVTFNGELAGNSALFVAVATGDGQVSDTDTLVGDELGPSDVVYNPTDNEFLIVWQEKQAGEWDIYGQQLHVGNGLYGGLITISSANQGQQRPRAAHNPDDDQYLVVWEDFRNESDLNVYAQKINSDGSEDGGNFVIANSAAAASQERPVVIYADNLDRYHIIWQDDRDAGTLGWDLRGQWLGSDGSSLGTLDAPVVRYIGDQQEPDIAYSGDSLYNRALTVWEDTRSGNSNIYGRFGTLGDTPPVAYFTRDPGVFRKVGTTFIFNAWPSRDDATPQSLLEVRWDVDGDGAWDDADFSYTKYVTHTFASTGWHTVTLEVQDEALLTDTLSLYVFTYAATAPSAPTATLTVSPALRTSGETFTFDGSGSAGGTLLARWDWENDGLFDTSFGTALTATHVYTVAGNYTVRLEVRDSGSGLSDAALHNIIVVSGDPVLLRVSPQEVTAIPGEVLRFRVAGWDQYDNVMRYPDVTWSLTDTQAGTIDASGVFTASVEADIYTDVVLVESGGVSDTASVTIFWPYQVYLPLALRDD